MGPSRRRTSALCSHTLRIIDHSLSLSPHRVFSDDVPLHHVHDEDHIAPPVDYGIGDERHRERGRLLSFRVVVEDPVPARIPGSLKGEPCGCLAPSGPRILCCTFTHQSLFLFCRVSDRYVDWSPPRDRPGGHTGSSSSLDL